MRILVTALSAALTPHYAMLSYNVTTQRQRKDRDREREREREFVRARSLHRYVNEKLRQRENRRSKKSNAAALVYMTETVVLQCDIRQDSVTTQ